MPVVQREILVQAPAQAVFDMVVDPEVAVRHVPNIVAVRDRSPGPIGLGSQWIQLMRVAGQQVEARVRVVEFEWPQVCTVEMSGMPGMRAHITLRVIPYSNGTLVQQLFDYHLPGGLLGLLANRLLIERTIQQEIEQNLTILKRVAEAEFRPPAPK